MAVDRTSKLVFARLYRKANKLAAQAFLKVLIRTVPYRIHTVLTDNGVQFSDQARTGEHLMVHPFTRLCWANGIEHRLTKPYHPWTNGQAERTVRTIKDATVHAFHYATIWELRRHVTDWLAAYNFAKQLKALRWRTPMEAITAVWQQKPDLFHNSPGHYSPGPNILGEQAQHEVDGIDGLAALGPHRIVICTVVCGPTLFGQALGLEPHDDRA